MRTVYHMYHPSDIAACGRPSVCVHIDAYNHISGAVLPHVCGDSGFNEQLVCRAMQMHCKRGKYGSRVSAVPTDLDTQTAPCINKATSPLRSQNDVLPGGQPSSCCCICRIMGMTPCSTPLRLCAGRAPAMCTCTTLPLATPDAVQLAYTGFGVLNLLLRLCYKGMPL